MTRSPRRLRLPARPARLAALAVLAVLAVLALGGPELGTAWTGYAPEEQHTAFAFTPPGFRDVPIARPALDGDPAAFDLLDPDRTGRLPCAGPDRAACPALDAAAAASRRLHLSLADAWQSGGTAATVPPATLDAALDLPAWAQAARAACAGDACPLEAVLEATRFLRLSPATLSAMDADGDGAVTRAEFQGAPRLSMHLLGSDGLGRDAFVRLLAGLRVSLMVGLLAALVAAGIGVAWGSLAAFAGGWVELVLMRLVDVLYGLPFIFLVILLISLAGPSTFNLLLAIALVQWLGMARTARATVRSILAAPYIESARALGCGPLRLAATHVLPNARRPLLAWAALLVPASIKEEAFLSFLGLGVQAPGASLGTLVSDGVPRLVESPWLLAAPSLTLFVLVLAIQVAAED